MGREQVSSLCNLSGLSKNALGVWERIGESTDAITFFQRVLQGDPPPSDGQRADIDGRIARLRAYEARRAAGIAAAPATSDEPCGRIWRM